MTDARLPFLRGRIDATEPFVSARGGGGSKPSLPSRDRATHRQYLTEQLDAIQRDVEARPLGMRDPDAHREIIAVSPAPGYAPTRSTTNTWRAM